MSLESSKGLQSFIYQLSIDYPHLVIPPEDVDTVLKQLDQVTSDIIREDNPDKYIEVLYWRFKINHTKADRSKKYDMIEKLIEEARDLDQPLYLLYGRLVEVFLMNERKYLSTLVSLVGEVAEFDNFHPLILEELLSHITRLSGFYVEVLRNSDSVERDILFQHIYSYLSKSNADERRTHFDQFTLINLLRFEEKITNDSLNLNNFLRESVELLGDDIPQYFEDPFKGLPDA